MQTLTSTVGESKNASTKVAAQLSPQCNNGNKHTNIITIINTLNRIFGSEWLFFFRIALGFLDEPNHKHKICS
jgi:protein involved in ribonucleotide reduction